MEPILNDRGRREWAWLCKRVGEDRARRALDAAVARGRRPFPLNAAREIGIDLPGPEHLPPIQTERSDQIAAQAMADIRRTLGRS